jgi:hypothetical protein
MLNLNEVCERHGIHPKFRREFFALVREGKRPGAEMLTRLECVDNYKAALDEVLADLSKPYAHLFEPSAGKATVESFTRFESLVPEECP